ncbi:MAG: hypothetical protein ACTSXG_04165 [Alphaproteobacteria bacterium]
MFIILISLILFSIESHCMEDNNHWYIDATTPNGVFKVRKIKAFIDDHKIKIPTYEEYFESKVTIQQIQRNILEEDDLQEEYEELFGPPYINDYFIAHIRQIICEYNNPIELNKYGEFVSTEDSKSILRYWVDKKIRYKKHYEKILTIAIGCSAINLPQTKHPDCKIDHKSHLTIASSAHKFGQGADVSYIDRTESPFDVSKKGFWTDLRRALMGKKVSHLEILDHSKQFPFVGNLEISEVIKTFSTLYNILVTIK